MRSITNPSSILALGVNGRRAADFRSLLVTVVATIVEEFAGLPVSASCRRPAKAAVGEATQEVPAGNSAEVFYRRTPGGKHALHLVKHLLADYGTDGDIRLGAFTLIRMTAFIDSGRFAGRGWPRGTRGSRPRSRPPAKERLQTGRNTKQGRKTGDRGYGNLTGRPDHSSLSVRPRNTWVKMSVSRMDSGSPWNATRPLSNT